jgi:hypothetical protein
MGTGIFLVVVGAILVFGFRSEPRAIDLDAVGLILMIAGGAIIHFARQGRSRTREVVRREDRSDPTAPTHVVRETVTDEDRPPP